MPHWFCQDTLCCLNQLSHAITPPLCSKKGGGHKNACVDKTLRCVSQRKLARKQNTGISTRKLALWPRKWCVSGGVSNSLRPCEMKDLFSTAQLPRLYRSRHVYEDFRLLCPFPHAQRLNCWLVSEKRVLPLFACTSRRFGCGALKKCGKSLESFQFGPAQTSKRRELVENCKLNQVV